MSETDWTGDQENQEQPGSPEPHPHSEILPVSLPNTGPSHAEIRSASSAESSGESLVSDAVPIKANQFFGLCVAFYSSMVIIAVVAGVGWGFRDAEQELSQVIAADWAIQLALGTGFAVGLLLGLMLIERLPFFQSIEDTIEQFLIPLFRQLSLWQIAAVALMAGVCEELLFRWCLQGGLAQWLPFFGALLIASVLFGLCHFVNIEYALVTGTMGIVLGLIMVRFGLLSAITTHAVYDFLAILYLMRSRKTLETLPQQVNP